MGMPQSNRSGAGLIKITIRSKSNSFSLSFHNEPRRHEPVGMASQWKERIPSVPRAALVVLMFRNSALMRMEVLLLSTFGPLLKLVATSYHLWIPLCSSRVTARSKASPSPQPFMSATRVNASIVSGFSLRFS